MPDAPILTRRHTAAGRQVILALGMLAALIVTSPTAYWLGGGRSVAIAAICAGVCWLGGGLATIIRTRLSRPTQAFQALGLAMAARMIPPMIFLICTIFWGPRLDKPDAIYYLLGFYMAALFLETRTALPRPGADRKGRESSTDATDHG